MKSLILIPAVVGMAYAVSESTIDRSSVDAATQTNDLFAGIEGGAAEQAAPKENPADILVQKLIKKMKEMPTTKPVKPAECFNAFKALLLDRQNIQKLGAFLLAWNGMNDEQKTQFAESFSSIAGADRAAWVEKLKELSAKKDLSLKTENDKFLLVYSTDFADIKFTLNKNDFTLLAMYTMRDMKKTFDELKSKGKVVPILDIKTNQDVLNTTNAPLKYQMTIYIKKDGSYYGRVINFILPRDGNDVTAKEIDDAFENAERAALQAAPKPNMDMGFSLDD